MSENSKSPLASPHLLALIAGLVIQTAGIVWWGAHIDQRMSTVEEKVAQAAPLYATIARLDERTATLVITVDRIDQRLNAQEDAAANRKP